MISQNLKFSSCQRFTYHRNGFSPPTGAWVVDRPLVAGMLCVDYHLLDYKITRSFTSRLVYKYSKTYFFILSALAQCVVSQCSYCLQKQLCQHTGGWIGRTSGTQGAPSATGPAFHKTPAAAVTGSAPGWC